MMTRPKPTEETLTGCLLGCAVGDALGLPFEGLRPGRVRRMLGDGPLEHRLVFGRGMVSDDTDHTVFVAQCLCRQQDDPAAFQRCLAWQLRLWLLALPAGIGFATLRSLLKLWVGVSPAKSGVFSAGNGPAMRSAIIGVVFAHDPERRHAFVSASTRLTHTDSKAEWGARAIADLAAFVVQNPGRKPGLDELREILEAISPEDHWRALVQQTLEACREEDLTQALAQGADRKGVSGYIYHTLPVAIAAWHRHYGDFPATLRAVIELGGDTDTVGAIAGALAGTATGPAGIPQRWIDGIIDRPHGPARLHRLARALATREPGPTRFSPWLFPRGLVFTTIVILHAFRRLLPPW